MPDRPGHTWCTSCNQWRPFRKYNDVRYKTEKYKDQSDVCIDCKFIEYAKHTWERMHKRHEIRRQRRQHAKNAHDEILHLRKQTEEQREQEIRQRYDECMQRRAKQLQADWDTEPRMCMICNGVQMKHYTQPVCQSCIQIQHQKRVQEAIEHLRQKEEEELKKNISDCRRRNRQVNCCKICFKVKSWRQLCQHDGLCSDCAFKGTIMTKHI